MQRAGQHSDRGAAIAFVTPHADGSTMLRLTIIAKQPEGESIFRFGGAAIQCLLPQARRAFSHPAASRRGRNYGNARLVFPLR